MSCCGRLRTQASLNATVRKGTQRTTSAAPLVLFEYYGATALTTVGPVTGTRYRFERPRARVAVDGRDAAAIAGVPYLRRIQG
jgi:hypothetical protein